MMKDSPFDAEAEMIPLRPGDVVIAGTDGIFDNLFEEEIVRVVEGFGRQDNKERQASLIAKALVEAAVANGWSSTYKSPFSKKAYKAGKKFTGGKLDDTTVVVGLAVDRRAD